MELIIANKNIPKAIPIKKSFFCFKLGSAKIIKNENKVGNALNT